MSTIHRDATFNIACMKFRIVILLLVSSILLKANPGFLEVGNSLIGEAETSESMPKEAEEQEAMLRAATRSHSSTYFSLKKVNLSFILNKYFQTSPYLSYKYPQLHLYIFFRTLLI